MSAKDDESSALSGLMFANTDIKDTDEKVNVKTKQTVQFVHIRIQQRNGRKSLTTVSGLAKDLNLKKILKVLKKTFSTNGAILKDKVVGKVIQLNGDQRKKCEQFFYQYHICTPGQVKIHGF